MWHALSCTWTWFQGHWIVIRHAESCMCCFDHEQLCQHVFVSWNSTLHDLDSLSARRNFEKTALYGEAATEDLQVGSSQKGMGTYTGSYLIHPAICSPKASYLFSRSLHESEAIKLCYCRSLQRSVLWLWQLRYTSSKTVVKWKSLLIVICCDWSCSNQR